MQAKGSYTMRDLRHVLTAVAVFAAACILTKARAESSSSGSTAMLQEVVVTAQKIKQRDVDVPVALTEVQGSALINQGSVQITDYYSQIPGLQVGAQPTESNGLAALSLRGITSGAGGSPTIAVMIDGIPFGSTTAYGQPPFPDVDPSIIERVEVLRGPQGTLYGASSLGGLIDLITKAPSLTATSGHLELGPSTVSGGNTGYSGRGSLNIPLISDHVALMVSGVYRTDPEWIENAFNGARDSNQVITRGGSSTLLIQPVHKLSISLSALAQHQTNQNSTGITVCPACANDPTAPMNFIPQYGKNTIDLSPSNGFNTFEVYSGKLAYDFGWATLTSLSAWNHTQWLNNNDVTYVFGFLPPLYGLNNGRVLIADEDQSSRFTQEVRLGSSGKHIDWLVGAYFNHETENVIQALNLFSSTGTSSGQPYDGTGPFYYFERALFADLTYHVTPAFSVQVGGRYSSIQESYYSVIAITGNAVQVFGPTEVIPQTTSSAHPVTWLVTPTYHINPNLMAYFRAASGYRPGGPNTGVPGVPLTYAPDTVRSYELGLKGYTLTRQSLKFDADIFEIDWKNIQLPDTNPATSFVFFTNGSAARSRGLELSGSWAPWRGFTISPSFTYTDAILTQDLPAPTADSTPLAGNEGDELPFTSKYAGDLNLQQTFALSSAVSAFVGADYSYVGSRLSEFRTNSPAAPARRFTLPGYGLVNFDAGIDWNDAWRLDLYAHNLGNKEGIVDGTNRNGTAQPVVHFTQPRTIGFNIEYNYGTN